LTTASAAGYFDRSFLSPNFIHEEFTKLAKGKITAQQLKHDPLMDQYLKSSEWARSRRQPLVTGLIIAAVLLAGFFGVRAFMSYRSEKAGAALAEGFCWNNAIVADPLPPAKAGTCACKTDDERRRKAAEAFEKAAAYHGDLARYYAAINQLYFDAPKGEATLRQVADGNSIVSSQARYGLAERFRVSGKYNEALAEYKKLKDKSGDIAPLLIDLGLAETHEAMGQTKEAAELYFNIAKESTKTTIGTRALTQLTKLDPQRAEQVPGEDKPSTPRGSIALPR
jgi:tetratricopeptide (TPR) repeat protein